jgi:hypothetical protein
MNIIDTCLRYRASYKHKPPNTKSTEVWRVLKQHFDVHFRTQYRVRYRACYSYDYQIRRRPCRYIVYRKYKSILKPRSDIGIVVWCLFSGSISGLLQPQTIKSKEYRGPSYIENTIRCINPDPVSGFPNGIYFWVQYRMCCTCRLSKAKGTEVGRTSKLYFDVEIQKRYRDCHLMPISGSISGLLQLQTIKSKGYRGRSYI